MARRLRIRSCVVNRARYWYAKTDDDEIDISWMEPSEHAQEEGDRGMVHSAVRVGNDAYAEIMRVDRFLEDTIFRAFAT